MKKWSRARLILSIVICEGLFATLRERMQYAPGQPDGSVSEDHGAGGVQTLSLPRHYDYAGALHIHSTYSDGTGSVDEIAEAADRAGLDFILLCDHANLDAHRNGQDGWRGRTLVLVGTEITTDAGHLLAVDVPDSFLPVSGNAVLAQKAIVESGGIGFIALPCDMKDHWKDFRIRRPEIGLEVFNLSAIARTKINLPALALIWRRYKSRQPNRAFHYVSARPARELRLWDTLMAPAEGAGQYNTIVGIASVDAHAVMRFGGREYPYPTYEEVFRTLRTHVVTWEPLSYGEVSNDRRVTATKVDTAAIHRALTLGHCYMSYDNYDDPTGFSFEAWGDERNEDSNIPIGAMGESIVLALGEAGRTILLRVRAPRSRSLVRLYRNGRLVAASRGGRLDFRATESGVYRTEVYLYRWRLGNLCLSAKPWIFSNAIYIQPSLVASVGGEPLAAQGSEGSPIPQN